MTTNFGGAIAGCHCSVPLQSAMVGGEGDDKLYLWGNGPGAIVES